MIAGWQSEGIRTNLVLRLPESLPGLYVIQTDASGERRFSYWRDSAAARLLFEQPETSAIAEALTGYDLLYFSGVTLSLYGEMGRQRQFETLDNARQQGCRVAFDTNFRARSWPDRLAAQASYEGAFDRTDIVLASTEDLDLLFGSEGKGKLVRLGSSAEIILKLPELACRVLSRGMDLVVRADPVARVVDRRLRATALLLPISPRASLVPTRRSPPLRAIAWQGPWFGIPAPSFRANECPQ